MKFRAKMTTVEAVQWNQPGDHPLVKTPLEAEQEGWWTPEDGVSYDSQTQGVIQTVDGPMIIGVGTWVIDNVGDITVRPTQDFEKLFIPIKGHRKNPPPQP